MSQNMPRYQTQFSEPAFSGLSNLRISQTFKHGTWSFGIKIVIPPRNLPSWLNFVLLTPLNATAMDHRLKHIFEGIPTEGNGPDHVFPSTSNIRLLAADQIRLIMLTITLLVPAFISDTFAQDTLKPAVDTVFTNTRSAMDYATDTTLTADIYLYGITFELDYDSTEIPLPGVVITLRDLYGEATQIVSNDTAYYEFELNFDNKYQIYFEYEGRYTKYIELDTRDVIDPEKERGYVFPTDVGMEKFKSFEAAAVLLRKPIGIAAFDRRSQTMNWDFRHTDKVRNEVDKLERKETKQTTKQ
jgi:hypothetical protein